MLLCCFNLIAFSYSRIPELFVLTFKFISCLKYINNFYNILKLKEFVHNFDKNVQKLHQEKLL